MNQPVKPPTCPTCGTEAALDATDGKPVDVQDDGWIVRFACKKCETRWEWRPYLLSSGPIPLGASKGEAPQAPDTELLPEEMDEILGTSLAEIFAHEPNQADETDVPARLRKLAAQLEDGDAATFVLVFRNEEGLTAATNADEADRDSRREIMNALTGTVIRFGGQK